MKTKQCSICFKEEFVLYRVLISLGKDWLFVCKNCCEIKKNEPNYKYGGTWKGSRH